MLLSAFQRTLGEVGVLDDDAPVLVALSGGLDSVVLLDVAVECLGKDRVIAAHVDHAVREGSAAQALQVAELVRAMGVDFESVRLPPGRPSEERLRDLRYEALEQIRARRGASSILVAHSQDDQAETVLLDLIRGGGGPELRGMPQVRDRIVRPFLHVPRAVIHDYARARRLTVVEDPSNLEPRYLRNRIRKELLPLLESRYRAKIARRLAERVAEAKPESTRSPPARNPVPSSPVASGDELSIEIEWQPSPVSLPRDLWTCVLDARVAPRPIVRLPRPGDRIELSGAGGHKKLQDVFVDAKVPQDRRRTRALVVADGQVVWVPGLVRAPIGLVGPETGPVWVITARK